jgi:hypothetical protein
MYKLNFRYYRYNSGRADNGTFDGSESFKTLDEAKVLKERIEKFIDETTENTKEENEWMDDFVMNYVWSGYIVSVGDIVQRTTLDKIVG